MIEQFRDFIKNNNLFEDNEQVLLAVSGGIDSMTMLELFMKCEFNFSIAHCNFALREAESDGDQEFVQRVAMKNNIQFFSKKFDTLNYANENKLSVQMAARELRYNWFNKIANEYGFKKIATGHNLNDVVETFLINLTRGTGIKGLTGIKPEKGRIIRPLLFAKRTAIKKYALENKIDYREDSSNAETKYLRNAIRHKIIPEFEQLNPSFLESIIHATDILKAADNSFGKSIEEIRKNILTEEGCIIKISKTKIDEFNLSGPELFEIMAPFGFTYDSVTKIVNSLENQPGKLFYSKTHKALIDRDFIILSEMSEVDGEEYTICEGQPELTEPIKLKLTKLKIDSSFSIIRNRSVATFDAEKLRYPLKLRRWKHGDHFFPFGMKGRKKLSDYFTDQKLSIIDKENVWVLSSGEDIIWIVNHRTDNRYKVSKSTKMVVQVELMKE